MDKKKILIVYPTPFFSPVSMNNYTRLVSIVQAGIGVDLLTFPEGEDVNLPDVVHSRYPSKPWFKNTDVGQYPKILAYTAAILIKVLFMRKGKYAAIYTSGTMTPVLWLVKYFSRIPIIALVISTLEDELPKFQVTSNKMIYKWFRYWDLFSLSRFDYVIFQQKSLYDRFIGKGLDKGRLFLIKRAAYVPEDSSGNVISGKHGFLVLYSGTFVEVQNLGLLLDVAGELKGQGVVFQMIGANDEEYTRYDRLIKRRGLTGEIQLYKRMPPQDLDAYIKAADLVISPRTAGFHDPPMKIFYYLFYSKCIIATDFPVHTGDLDHSTAVLVKDDAKAIAAKILELMRNPSRIREKEKAALELYQREYSQEIQAEKYRRFFQVMGKQRGWKSAELGGSSLDS